MKAITAGLACILSAAVAADRIVDTTDGVANVCPVHRIEMRKQEALVGKRLEAIACELRMRTLARTAKVDLERERKLKFPFPVYLQEPGCGEMEPSRVMIYVCNSCTLAKADWIRQKEADAARVPKDASR